MNITIGKYVPGNTFVHRLDPRVKLLTNIMFIILVFITKSFIIESIMLAPIIFAFIVSGLRKKQLLTSLIPVIFIGIFLFFINMLVIKSTGRVNLHIYYSFGNLAISNLAIYRTLLIMFRIYIMILVTTILTATTRPMGLTRAIEDLLWPLKLLFVPVHIIAMIISIALRFIPTLLEESQRIMKAQASRGVDFKNGNIKSKTKSIITLMIPLFVSAFAKAEDLGNAMETRGYEPYEKRTKYREYPINFLDIFVFCLICMLSLIVILQYTNVIYVPTWMVYS